MHNSRLDQIMGLESHTYIVGVMMSRGSDIHLMTPKVNDPLSTLNSPYKIGCHSR